MLVWDGQEQDYLTNMAAIIQRTFTDGVNKGIALGAAVSASYDGSMTRAITIGSNWSVIRMGLLCGIKGGLSQSYNRNLGLCLGFCSGSTTDLATSTNYKTWVGAMFGSYIFGNTQYPNIYMFWNYTDVNSGSWYGIDTCWMGGQTTNSIDTNSTVNMTTSTGHFWFANNATVPARRMPLILEISASSTTVMTIKAYGPSGSLQNIDYTTAQLLAALTSSNANGITGSNGAQLFAAKTLGSIVHNFTTFPIGTAFVDWAGGCPFEIYDWYIYKVR